MQTYKVEVPRGSFNVRDSGNRDGYPVVMQHGWPESSYCWEQIAPYMSRDLRIIAPDLRGLGDSERTLKPELYQKRELAQDIIQVVDALGIRDFFLAGHDWGGNIVQEMAFAIPERIKRLVIMNFPILANARGNAEAMAIHQKNGGVAFMYQYFQQQKGLPEAMIRGNEEVWIRWCFGAPGREGKIPAAAIEEYIRCYSIENTPATGAFYYRNMRNDVKRWQELEGKKITIPTMYIYGNKDKVIIPAYLNHIEDCFDQLAVHQIDADHFLQEERPREVADLLNSFFKL
jgi:pimeloyl-ACP methyl ester carboxylesterase